LCFKCKKKFEFNLHKTSILNYNHFYFSHYTSDLKKLFFCIKFQFNKHLLIEFSKLFLLRNIDLNLKGYDYYVQIPYHKSRLKARGYNVLDYLFDFLETKYSLKKIPLLTRKKSTKSLSLYKKLDRSIILDDIFELNPVHIKPNTKILLVDDIVTTQSTMKAALKILSDVSSIETISCLSIIKV
jgi:ComF family protein